MTDVQSVEVEPTFPFERENENIGANVSTAGSPLSNSPRNGGSPNLSSRSTRSRENPEFVAKQKLFFAKVQAASAGSSPSSSPVPRLEYAGKRKRESTTPQSDEKRKKTTMVDSNVESKATNSVRDFQNDICCWECHKEGQFICCEMCPRVFHLKCANLDKEPEEEWACSECHSVMEAENIENRSRAMQLISVDQLCTLLKYALDRLKSMSMMEPFINPVDVAQFPTYKETVIHPVDFTSLEENIERKFYGSTEAFLSDAKWIVHNSVLFNTANSKVTALARTMVKIVKQEMSEIETCPDCYFNAHEKPDCWFVEACRLAHPLVWARLKGFPFWPAKAVKWKEGNVDVRFFGRHDRSWIPLKECYLFSEQMPTPLKSRNKTLENCLLEVSSHIEKLGVQFGEFCHAPHRLPFNPYDNEQINLMLPQYKGPAILRIKATLRSASRQSGSTDDDTSSIASSDSTTSFCRRLNLKDSLLIAQETEIDPDVRSNDGDNLSEIDREEDINDISKNCTLKEDEDTLKNDDKSALSITERVEDAEKTVSNDLLNSDSVLNDGESDSPVNNEDFPTKRRRIILRKSEKLFGLESKKCESTAQESDDSKSDVLTSINSSLGKVNTIKVNIFKTTKQGTGNSICESLSNVGNSSISTRVVTLRKLPKAQDETNDTKLEEMPKENDDADDNNGDSDAESGTESCEEGSKKLSESSLSSILLSRDQKVLQLINKSKKNLIEKRTDEKGKHINKQDCETSAVTVTGDSNIDLNDDDVECKNDDMEIDSNEVIDENILNLERINALLMKDDNNAEKRDADVKNEKLENVGKLETEDTEFGSLKICIDTDEEMEDVDKEVFENEKDKCMENKTEEVKEKDDGKIEKETAKIDEEDYFKGFLENLDFKEKIENCKNIFKSLKDLDKEKGDSMPAKKNSPEQKSDYDDFSKQLMGNSSLTVGLAKVIQRRASYSDGNAEGSSDTVKSILKHTSSYGTLNISKVSGNDAGKGKTVTDTVRRFSADDELRLAKEKLAKIDKAKSLSSTSIDLKNFTNKIFHNITISKNKETSVNQNTPMIDKLFEESDIKTEPDFEKDDGKTMRENLSKLDGVSVSKSFGNVSIKPVEKLTESSSDKAASKHSSPSRSETKTKNIFDPLSAISTSVVVTKASEREREKVKMPSGVDTTRLSPSISITAVSSSTSPIDKKPKITPVSSEATVASTVRTTTAGSTSISPIVWSGSSIPSLITPSNLPPPPLLSHPSASPTSSLASRFPGHLPPLGLQSTPRHPGSANIRMMGNGNVPPVMLASRMPGAPHQQRGPHVPPEAGPLATELHKHSHKLAEMMRTSLEEVLAGLVGIGTPEARVAVLQLELERCNWRHQQELAEVRHNADVMLVEMRANLEAEKQRAVEEARRTIEQKIVEMRRQLEMQMSEKLAEMKRQSDIEKQRVIEETKKKQWCANCGKEALFFCCWNTSYCDYPCQQSHWPQHMSVCGQNSESGGSGGGGGGAGGSSNNVDATNESLNGESNNPSGQSSGVTTPVQNVISGLQQPQNPSPIFNDSLSQVISQANSGSMVNNNPMVVSMGQNMATSPHGQPLGAMGHSPLRPMAPGQTTMAAIAAMTGQPNPSPQAMQMEMPRFMQHTMMSQQVGNTIFGALSPRMMMMMGRNIHNPAAAAMMRGHIQQFRPRFL